MSIVITSDAIATPSSPSHAEKMLVATAFSAVFKAKMELIIGLMLFFRSSAIFAFLEPL
jgi:hypothetical protein